MRAIFTGFDSAWYPNKTGAMCDLSLEADSLAIASQPFPAAWDTALTHVNRHRQVELHVWAIDQPLVVPNEQGCRQVDVDLMRALMRDFSVGAHTANLRRPPWLPGAPIWQLLHALEVAGYRHDPAAVPHATVGRFYLECYPHPALIGLFNLERIVRYKKHAHDNGEWTQLLGLVRWLGSAELPIANIADFVPLDLVHNKRNEDMVDSILCAYIAAYWWRFGTERSSLIGDLSSGYMVTPHSRRTKAALERIFGGRLNQTATDEQLPNAAHPNRDLVQQQTLNKPDASITTSGKYDWIYFAQDSRWNLERFRSFVLRERLIVRTIHSKARIPIPNVLRLKEGDRILLVYKAKGRPYRQLFACTIGRSPNPVRTEAHLFDVFSRIDSRRFEEEMRTAKFDPDPVVGGFTGICISEVEDLYGAEIVLQKPVAMMAIQRWDAVFPGN